MISKGEFELIDDVLCGVDNNPRRVKMARNIARKAMKENAAYNDLIKAIGCDLKEVQAMISLAGLCFLFDAETMGHEEIQEAIAKLDEIKGVIVNYV